MWANWRGEDCYIDNKKGDCWSSELLQLWLCFNFTFLHLNKMNNDVNIGSSADCFSNKISHLSIISNWIQDELYLSTRGKMLLEWTASTFYETVHEADGD